MLSSPYFVNEENELREVASCPRSYSGLVSSGEWHETYPAKGSCPWRAVLPGGCLTVTLSSDCGLGWRIASQLQKGGP